MLLGHNFGVFWDFLGSEKMLKMLNDFFPGHSNESWFIIIIVELIEHMEVDMKFLQNLRELSGYVWIRHDKLI